jgi:DNA-binding LacI/PurR family transcriptional regulator
MRRPTHRDIAKLAGVSHVTVSLALRGHRSIPKSTRERIEKIAKDIGYRPDPFLRALMVYRRGAKPSGYQGTLAWINNYQVNPEQLKQHFYHYFAGAEERCAELGYQIEEFRPVHLNMSFARLSKVLRARNIQGLLFPPQGRRRYITRTDFSWDDFSSVAFGYSLLRPQLDVVTNSQFRSARLAVRTLRSLGYRRIGFITETEFNERTDQNFMAGFLIEQHRFLPSEQVPVHYFSRLGPDERVQPLRQWFRKYRPDAVLVINGPAEEAVRTMKPSERRHCAWALVDVPDGDLKSSGIYQNNHIIGRVAVDTLIAKIHANERGIPANPRRILVEGRWLDGTTAPRITGK